MLSPDKEFMLHEISTRYKIKLRTLQRFCKSRKIVAEKRGLVWVVRWKNLKQYLKNRGRDDFMA